MTELDSHLAQLESDCSAHHCNILLSDDWNCCLVVTRITLLNLMDQLNRVLQLHKTFLLGVFGRPQCSYI
jgi:hypothetical protein